MVEFDHVLDTSHVPREAWKVDIANSDDVLNSRKFFRKFSTSITAWKLVLRMLSAMVAGTFFSWWNNLLIESLKTFVKSCIAKHWSKMIACETVIAKLRLNEWASNILWIRCKGNQNFITCHLSSGIDRVHRTITLHIWYLYWTSAEHVQSSYNLIFSFISR